MKTITATTLLSLTIIGNALCQNVGVEFNQVGDLTFIVPGLPAIPFVCTAMDGSTGKNVGAEKLVKGTKDDPQPPPNGPTFKFGDAALKLSVTPTINGKTCDMLVKWDTSANPPGFLEQKILLAEEIYGDLTVEVDGVAMTQNSTDAVNLNDGDKIAVCGGWIEGMNPWSAMPGAFEWTGYKGLAGLALRECGIRNAPFVGGLDRVKTDAIAAGIDNVIADAPAYVVLANLGTGGQNAFTEPHPNEAYIKNIGAILAKLKAAKIRTIIATSHIKYTDPAGCSGANNNMAEYNDVIREAAQKYEATLIDFTKILDETEKTIPMDASPEAAAWVNQMFAGELLRVLGYSDKDVAACRKAWTVKGGSKITAKRTSSGKVLFEMQGEFPRVRFGAPERAKDAWKEIVICPANMGPGMGLLDMPESRWQIKFP